MTARDTFDLTLTRTIRAPRAKVFDAFVNPDQLRRWFGPRGHAVAEATVDAKIGGRYRLVHAADGGEDVCRWWRVSRDRLAVAARVHLEVGRRGNGRDG